MALNLKIFCQLNEKENLKVIWEEIFPNWYGEKLLGKKVFSSKSPPKIFISSKITKFG